MKLQPAQIKESLLTEWNKVLPARRELLLADLDEAYARLIADELVKRAQVAAYRAM